MSQEPMRLEMAEFPVREARLGQQTRYRGGTLELDPQEVRAIALEDSRVAAAKVEVVAPGEKARIFGIRDVVEPRVKVSGRGRVFPGILGPVEPVGEGRDHRLSGVRVMVAADYEHPVQTGHQYEESTVLDMWGPGAEASEYSRDVAVVVVLGLAPDLAERDAHEAIQQAGYKVARRLAETTKNVDQEPGSVEVFQLTQDVSPSLPRVVLVQGAITLSQDPPHSGLAYYGLPIRESLNTLVHPNEFLDGVLTPYTLRAVGHWPRTYEWMNHPVVLALYREHGRRLNFVGVVLERIRFETQAGKEVTSWNATQMAEMLGAQGAVVAWTGEGNAFMDVMLTIRNLEQRGIKTVLVSHETPGSRGTELSFVFSVPEATAIVSTGNFRAPLELPGPERAVGPGTSVRTAPGQVRGPAKAPLTLETRMPYLGGADNWGAGRRTVRLY